MPNPFQHRASEYQRGEAEFLATLAPSLFRLTLHQYDDPEELLAKTVVLTAPPGTGKTTLARFFQFSTLTRLVEQAHRTNDRVYEDLADFAQERGFIRDGKVVVCGARISLERDYRELAQIGYSEHRAHELLLSLIGARAVRAWKQAFLDAGIALNDVTVDPSEFGAARLEHLGGATFDALVERAAEVESVIYRLTATFIPPSEEGVLQALGGPFLPLLAIGQFRIQGRAEPLRPLLMIDDAHWIDQGQRRVLADHLTLREISMARWLLQRVEALDPQQILLWDQTEAAPTDNNLQRARNIVDIRVAQAVEDKRGGVRRQFRKAAAEVASRYMAQLQDLARDGVRSLAGLPEEAEPTRRQQEFSASVMERTIRDVALPNLQVEEIKQLVYSYVGKQSLDIRTIAPAMIAILLHRQAHRAPQTLLFAGTEDESLVDPVRVEADADVAAGAKVQLFHNTGLPYLAGFDTVADLGTENVETFLRLIWPLVSLLETKAIRGDSTLTLTAKQQHEALQREGERIVKEWSFPHALTVRRIVKKLAEICLERSLEKTAPLGGGANGIGIEQNAFTHVLEYPKLVEALRYGIGYNAFTLIPGRRAKGKLWTVLELSGPVIAAYGLTTRRGGFVPTQFDVLREVAEGGQS